MDARRDVMIATTSDFWFGARGLAELPLEALPCCHVRSRSGGDHWRLTSWLGSLPEATKIPARAVQVLSTY
jgi:hypothetical protein